jgi:hypothetical protein
MITCWRSVNFMKESHSGKPEGRSALRSLRWLLDPGFKSSIAAHNLISCLIKLYIKMFCTELPNDIVR